MVPVLIGVWAFLFLDFIEGDRDAWVKYKFGISVSPVTMVGKDGWLFAGGGGQAEIDEYRGVAKPDKQKLVRLREVLTERNDYVRSTGARFAFVIGPRGETLYNE